MSCFFIIYLTTKEGIPKDGSIEAFRELQRALESVLAYERGHIDLPTTNVCSTNDGKFFEIKRPGSAPGCFFVPNNDRDKREEGIVRKLATIRTISDIRPIKGADRIEVAQVDGWECVVQKGEFNVGDTVVYVEIDSVLPERPEFEFLRERKFRVRTIKLRGQVSQGLVLPLSILPSGYYGLGDDVTDILGIIKYDPEAQKEMQLLTTQKQQPKSKFVKFMMRFGWYRKVFGKPKRKGGFPDWIVKTDETRIQNMPILFEHERDSCTPFSVTEKVDGQSATYFLRKITRRKYEFGVCSRNIRLMNPDNSSYWTVAKEYNIENVLKSIIGKNDSVVLQGEICGPGIQGNKYKLDGYKLFVFNLIYPNKSCTTEEIAQIVDPFYLKTVPIIEEGRVLPDTIADLVDYSKGQSVVYGRQKREGVVMRNNTLHISFKVINPDFLLAEKE